MMKKISDERLEQMLTDYYEADGELTFTFVPGKKVKKIIPLLRIKRLSAVACLVLISMVSLIVFFSIGKKIDSSLSVAPSRSDATSPSASVGGGDNDDRRADNGIFPQDLLPNKKDLPEASDVTGDASLSDHDADPDSSDNASATPYSKIDPTEKTGERIDDRSAPVPSEDRPQPTIQDGSSPAAEDPTTSDSFPPVEPTDDLSAGSGAPGAEYPPGGGTMAGNQPCVSEYFNTSYLENSNHVYCAVYNSEGQRLGSDDMFDQQHTALIPYQTRFITYAEYPVPFELIEEEGLYTFVFYNANGTVITQSQWYI